MFPSPWRLRRLIGKPPQKFSACGNGLTDDVACVSTNEKNLCKAVMAGLARLRTREQVAAHRGVTIETTVVDEVLESAKRFLSHQQEGGERKKAAAPVNVVGQERKRGGGGRGGRRRGPSARKPEASGAMEPNAPVTGASPESAPAKPPESAEPAAE